MTNKPVIWFWQGKDYILIKYYHIPTEVVKRLPLASIGIELDPQEPPLPFIQTQQTVKWGVCNVEPEEKNNTAPTCLRYQHDTVGLGQCNWWNQQLLQPSSICTRKIEKHNWTKAEIKMGSLFSHVRRVLHVLELPKKEMQILLEYLSSAFGHLILTICLEA